MVEKKESGARSQESEEDEGATDIPPFRFLASDPFLDSAQIADLLVVF
jgi:hypothetical protein